jgi:hypothetical protein
MTDYQRLQAAHKIINNINKLLKNLDLAYLIQEKPNELLITEKIKNQVVRLNKIYGGNNDTNRDRVI